MCVSASAASATKVGDAAAVEMVRSSLAAAPGWPAAVLHPPLGKGLGAVTGGKALIAASKKMGGPGQVLDVPLGREQAMPVTDSGRPYPCVGGLNVDEVVGQDGLP